eukprot:TRINITY_DN2382_c0_g2_i3.p1 TRINITY_DN2382_c0_g2~~TRINITY_DN2382_c0_g2_i3.p1  ORF type:complete len:352 (-),score=44.76 TRINITY_DN2382_c0_g2_i3:304-1359(-)
MLRCKSFDTRMSMIMNFQTPLQLTNLGFHCKSTDTIINAKVNALGTLFNEHMDFLVKYNCLELLNGHHSLLDWHQNKSVFALLVRVFQFKLELLGGDFVRSIMSENEELSNFIQAFMNRFNQFGTREINENVLIPRLYELFSLEVPTDTSTDLLFAPELTEFMNTDAFGQVYECYVTRLDCFAVEQILVLLKTKLDNDPRLKSTKFKLYRKRLTMFCEGLKEYRDNLNAMMSIVQELTRRNYMNLKMLLLNWMSATNLQECRKAEKAGNFGFRDIYERYFKRNLKHYRNFEDAQIRTSAKLLEFVTKTVLFSFHVSPDPDWNTFSLEMAGYIESSMDQVNEEVNDSMDCLL